MSNTIQIKHGTDPILAKNNLKDFELGYLEGANVLLIKTPDGELHIIGGTGEGGDIVITGPKDAVLYIEQKLTEQQKAQARENIGVKEEIANILLSLDFIKPLGDDEGILGENDETFIIIKNDEFFLPEVGLEDENSILQVKNNKWQPQKGLILTSPNGTHFSITVNDDGSINSIPIK